MLQPKLKIDSKTSDGKQVTIVDDTGTVSETNPGGYGAPNEIRGNLYGGLLVELRSEGEVTAIEVDNVPVDATPLNIAKWNINPERDGYYRLLFILAPLFNPNALYLPGRVVFYDGKFYTTPVGSDGELINDTYFWKEITKPSEYPFLAESAGAYFGLLDYLHTLYSEIFLAQKTVDFVSESKEESPNAVKDYVWRDALYKAANYQAGFGDFTKAGELIDELVRESEESEHCSW